MMRYRVFGSAGFLLLLIMFSTSGKAQSICVISEMKISEVKGIIFLPNKIPIPDATVELHEKNSEGRIIAQVKTDENGRFKFADVASGKYAIVASYPTLVTLHVPVRVTSKARKSEQKEIVIILNGLIDKPCGDGDAYLQDQKQSEKKQKTAHRGILTVRRGGR
ncbi:MAG TPA: carboxypeptidase-like regulatory domain-containing protein [Pyrinomonadaceae bacterium]|nr:carboxypeptidase-like regulatory domain-containing protein [Pyrinomonadaceae bacterium]